MVGRMVNGERMKMNGIPNFNPRSDARKQHDEPGPGDDVPCEKCGAVALDTGLECNECGYDNYEAVTGRPFSALPWCGSGGLF